jgi:hypothetical protein
LWAFEGKSYVYEAVPDTLASNQNAQSIRFELREIEDEDENLEVVIQKRKDGSYFFKTDYYDEPEKEYPLKAFTSPDEIIFYSTEIEGVAYFHLSAIE